MATVDEQDEAGAGRARATVSFHAAAIVHPAGAASARAVPGRLVSLLPAERRAWCCVIEILPEGQFLTYGLGVSLKHMRNPSAARARVPVGPAGGAKRRPAQHALWNGSERGER